MAVSTRKPTFFTPLELRITLRSILAQYKRHKKCG
jgi:hypothetical protein